MVGNLRKTLALFLRAVPESVSINEIEVAEGITIDDKNKMIQNTIDRRNADLEFTKNLYSAMPTWDFSWVDIAPGGMPNAPGYSSNVG